LSLYELEHVKCQHKQGQHGKDVHQLVRLHTESKEGLTDCNAQGPRKEMEAI